MVLNNEEEVTSHQGSKNAIRAYLYLLGWQFHIVTDHRSFEWFDKLKENNIRLSYLMSTGIEK